MLRVHCLTHVAFEGPGTIEQWVHERGHQLDGTSLPAGDSPPETDAFDLLVVMGGPMCTRDDDQHPWLADERRFLTQAIEAGRHVLGICLGAQLLAEVLGGNVTRNDQRTIGWFPVHAIRNDAVPSSPFAAFPSSFTPFHWHGDACTLPPAATLLATSDSCRVQAFEYDAGRITALQFHPELSIERIEAILARCADDLDEPGPWLQRPSDFLARHDLAEQVRVQLFAFLDALVAPLLAAAPDAATYRA